jgi:hypothetical protein
MGRVNTRSGFILINLEASIHALVALSDGEALSEYHPIKLIQEEPIDSSPNTISSLNLGTNFVHCAQPLTEQNAGAVNL